jgi:hypothetical protein
MEDVHFERPVGLTESEADSLLNLEPPQWWQDESPQNQLLCGDDKPAHKLRGLFPRRSFSLSRQKMDHPLWEGKSLSRHWLNRRAIVAVGEHQSFVHVPRVGTRWIRDGRMEIVLTRTFAFRQYLWQVFVTLLPILARKANRNWIRHVIPYCPFPGRAALLTLAARLLWSILGAPRC